MASCSYTFCNICLANCGLKISVGGGRINEIRGDEATPHSRGGLCLKGRFAHKIAFSPHRLTTPLIRSQGKLKPASWKAALEMTAEQLERLRAEHGPQSLGIYRGTSSRFLSNTLARAFGRLYGTPNVSGTWSLCVGPKIVGYRAVFGRPFSISDFARARLIVLFGTNPQATRMHRYFNVVGDISRAVRSGARLVVVDPRKTPLARQAQVHLALNPGTDSWLIMALAAGLIRSGGYDRNFVERRCAGFQELASSLAGFDTDKAARITGLSRRSIDRLTHDLATLKPAALDRREGLIHQADATATNQGLAVLIALSGNVDRPGGLIMPQRTSLNASLGLRRPADPPFWKAEYPLAEDASGLFPEAMSAGKIRGLISIAGNPLAAWPRSGATETALDGLDFLLVNDLFLTETAQRADVVLPAACFLEKSDLESGLLKPGVWLRTTGPVIPPPGSARSEWRWLVDLAKALGYDELDWITDADSIMARILADSGLGHLDPAELRRGIQLAPQETGRHRKEGFDTPSGLIELSSSLLKDCGYDPLPRPGDSCPLSDAYPWRLITGHRSTSFYHSGQRNIPELRRPGDGPVIELSPLLAEKTGLAQGDPALVETATGRLEMPVRLVPGMNSATVALPHGWPGQLNANRLIPDHVRDPVAATPAYRALPCRIGPA